MLHKGKRVYSRGMKNTEIENLKKELDRLGIISIEADSGIDTTCIADTVQAVKNLDSILNIENLLEANNNQLAKMTQQKRAVMQ